MPMIEHLADCLLTLIINYLSPIHQERQFL